MVQRVLSICLLLFLTATPSFCANAASAESGKSGYIQLMFLFLTLLILLLVWEFVEFFLKKKSELKVGDSTEAVSVISEEPKEEDPFRALLREETSGYVAAAAQQTSEHEEEEAESTQIAAPQFISEPLPVVEEKKERAKRTVHLDVSEPPAEVKREAAPPPVAPEEKKSAKIPAKPNIDEQGWRDLMQKASQEHDDETPRKEAPVFARAKESSREEVLETVEEDDPWKALLKKSKQAEEVVKEEEKPWSVFLKSEKMRKGKGTDDEKESSYSNETTVPARDDTSVASSVTSKLFADQESKAPPFRKEMEESPLSSPWHSSARTKIQESEDSSTLPPVITFEDDKKEDAALPPLPSTSGTPSSSPTPRPAEQERKKAISLGGARTDSEEKGRISEIKLEEKPLPSVKEKKSIDLRTDKKKEEAGDEKKSSSKEATSLSVKKAPRVISIAPSDVDDGEGESAKKNGEMQGISKEGKKILSIDGTQKKARNE